MDRGGRFLRATCVPAAIAAGMLIAMPGAVCAAQPDGTLRNTAPAEAAAPAGEGYLVGQALPLGGAPDEAGPLLRFGSEASDLDQDPALSRAGVAADQRELSSSLDLGYQWLRGSNKVSVFLGPRFRSLDPDHLADPTYTARDTGDDRLGLRGQLDLSAGLGEHWNMGVTGSYTTAFRDYLLRLRPGYRLSDSLTVGPEAAILGGESYERMQLGLFASGYRLGASSLGLKLGLERDNRNDDYGGYLGLRFSRPF